MSRKPKGFVLSAGKRPSGAIFWIVRGSIGGKQERREFSDRSEALRYQEQQNSILFGIDVAHAAVTTRLAPDQVHDAEIAVAQMAREFPGKSLLDIVDYYRHLAPIMTVADAAQFKSALLALRKKYPDASLPEVCAWFTQHFRPAKNAVTLKIALEHYLADALRRKNRGSLSVWQFASIGFAMAQLEFFFGSDSSIADLTTFRLTEYLKATTKARDGSNQYSNKTWSNRRGYLTKFFKYCVKELWLDENPAKGLENYTKKDFNRPPPSVLRAKEAKDLMSYLEKHANGRMIPFFVLTLFCGIRPTWWHGEVARITPEQFNFTQRELTLRADKTKTKKPRIVRLQPNVIRWLKAYPLDHTPLGSLRTLPTTHYKAWACPLCRPTRTNRQILR